MRRSKTTIYYIASSSKENVIQLLQEEYQAEGVEFVEYFKSIPPELTFLMIVEPIRIKSEQYAISRVWRRGLRKQGGHTHLIVAGYAESPHPNFLNLTNLPESLCVWLSNVLPIDAFALQHAGYIQKQDGTKEDKFVDPWDRLLPTRGIDMIQQMQKFLDGHDPHNSFYNQLSRLRKTLVDLDYTLQKEEKNLNGIKNYIQENKTKDEWEYLVNRWNFYKDFFKYLPFQSTVEQIEHVITQELKPFFNNWQKYHIQELQQLRLYEKLDCMKIYVQEDIEKYINLESYW